MTDNKPMDDKLEGQLLKDKAFQHILKFAPASQRELMTFELARYFTALLDSTIQEAEKRGVAWAVGVIDDMHINGSNLYGEPSFDSLFKGIKNTMRDRYRFEIGIDPAPDYPVKAALTPPEREG